MKLFDHDPGRPNEPVEVGLVSVVLTPGEAEELRGAVAGLLSNTAEWGTPPHFHVMAEDSGKELTIVIDAEKPG